MDFEASSLAFNERKIFINGKRARLTWEGLASRADADPNKIHRIKDDTVTIVCRGHVKA